MPNKIEHIVEPNRLLLTWQAMSDDVTRTRFAVGELTAAPTPRFRYYNDDEFAAINGRPLSEIRALGYVQYPAFRPDRVVHEHGVIEAFMRRLPPRGRKDFENYKRHFLIGGGFDLTDISLLALTEARLPSDGFSLVDPLDDSWSRRSLFIEVVGHRYYAASCDLDGALGEAVSFVPEPENPHDGNAVYVTSRDQKIGYINRFQCGAFLTWVTARRLHAVIERINGEPAKPRVHLFVRVLAANQKVAA